MVSVEFKDLTKSYNGQPIFKKVSGTLQEGKCMVITGPNGSGKTTILKILAGLIRPSSGEVKITVNDHCLKGEERNDYLGFVSPDIFLYDELTAYENLSFFAKVRGLPVYEEKCRQFLKRVQLEKWKDSLTGTFSTGMKQRLKFAFALLHDPYFLLLDEPGTNLDEEGRALLGELVYQQKKRGAVILS
ncbi:MAG: ABC transporter ATP-binding protein, partial [Candidatus Syntrophonatronum acetioxidans]